MEKQTAESTSVRLEAEAKVERGNKKEGGEERGRRNPLI